MGTGIIVLGHGSRREEANQEILQIADLLQAEDKEAQYRVAFLAFGQPGLPVAAGELIEQGAEKIIIVPVFLVTGNHIMQDIPEELAALKSAFPKIEFVLARHLGPDPAIAGIIRKRIEETVNV